MLKMVMLLLLMMMLLVVMLLKMRQGLHDTHSFFFEMSVIRWPVAVIRWPLPVLVDVGIGGWRTLTTAESSEKMRSILNH